MTTQNTFTIAIDTSQASISQIRNAATYVEGINNALRTRFYGVDSGAGRILNQNIGSRASVQWSCVVNKQRGEWTSDDVRFVTRTALSQIASAARATGWGVDGIVSSLPATGNGSVRPNLLIGEPARVQRFIQVGSQPTDFSVVPSTAVVERTVASGTGNTPVGMVVPSSIEAAARRAASAIEDYRTPVIIGGVAVATMIGAFLVWRVTK